MSYSFRRAIQSDLDAMYVLNQVVFSESWSRPAFDYAWEIAYDMVVCVDEKHAVIAYYLAQSMFDEKEIMQLAVSPTRQNIGVGFALMRYILDMTPDFVFHLEVRASNQAAISLYQKLGFQRVGCRKNYYKTKEQGKREDALLMRYASSNQMGQ